MFDEGKSKSEIEDVPLIVPSQSFRTLDVVCSAVLDAYPLLTLVFLRVKLNCINQQHFDKCTES